MLAAVTLLAAAPAFALPITPIDFNWRASLALPDPTNTWDSNTGTSAWTNTGAPLVATGSALPGMAYAFDFSGGTPMDGPSFQSIAGGNPSDETISLELWFRPDSTTGGQQVLFETGGGADGLSILLDDTNLMLRVKDGGTSFTLNYDLGSDVSEFFQVVAVLTPGGDASFYVDGTLRGTVTGLTSLLDWSSNGGATLGGRNGSIGGSVGGDLNGYGNFAGQIGLVRYYRDRALTAAEVQQNYDTIATPEPGTALLVALGLAGLGFRRRRAPRSPSRPR